MLAAVAIRSQVLAIALVLAFAGAAGAETQTASSGAVHATITASKRERSFHVTIVRAQSTLVDEPVTIDEGPADAWLEPLRWGDDPAVAVRDLDSDGEPEVLVDVYTGGAHCCNVTKLWSFDGTAYRAVQHYWGNVDYRLGANLLVGLDDFSYVFSSYVGSASPVKVLDARLQDVTAEHPRIVERDLRHWRREYARDHLRAVLAAIVADLHSLGHHAEADRLLESELRRGRLRRDDRYDAYPAGRAFIRCLDDLLREGGYLPP